MRNRLPELRAERGWSQVELAERLGVSRQTVNAIENERYDPSLPLAFRIGRVFELPIEEIFDPDGGRQCGVSEIACAPRAPMRPAGKAATTEDIGPYLREEQRRRPGCSGGRMPSYFGDTTLVSEPASSRSAGRDRLLFDLTCDTSTRAAMNEPAAVIQHSR
jgi:putative transcriptional regulator